MSHSYVVHRVEVLQGTFRLQRLDAHQPRSLVPISTFIGRRVGRDTSRWLDCLIRQCGYHASARRRFEVAALRDVPFAVALRSSLLPFVSPSAIQSLPCPGLFLLNCPAPIAIISSSLSLPSMSSKTGIRNWPSSKLVFDGSMVNTSTSSSSR